MRRQSRGHLLGRGARWAAPLLALTFLAGACTGGGSDSATGGERGGVFRLGIVEPVAIDPYNSQEPGGESVTSALFDGLVNLDPETSEITPGVARNWLHDPDCTQWVFQLRPGTTFSTGEPVTAQSFIDGMTRAAARDAGSATAHFLDDIEGYEAVHGTGAGAPPTATTLSGLSAPDEQTLVVKLSRPNCEFDKLTLRPVFSPVPKEAGGADPNSAFYAMPIGNGPFKMREPWNRNVSISLVRNDAYHGKKAHLDGVDFTVVRPETAIETEYWNFQEGRADWARIPPVMLPQAEATYEPRDEFMATPTFGVNFLLANVANPPLNDVRARRAISLAIDRDAVIRSVFNGFQTKATSLIPPPLEAFHQPDGCTVCTLDADKAKQLAREGGIPPGTKVRFSFNTGGGHEAWVQAVAQQLRDTLGLDIDLQGMPFRELLEKEEAPDATGLFRASWAPDLPSADDFLRPLLSSASLPPGDNRSGYRNPEFDSLLDQALKAEGKGKKAELTKKAERLAVGEDLVLIPLWYRTQYRVVSNRFKDVTLDFFEYPAFAEIRLA